MKTMLFLWILTCFVSLRAVAQAADPAIEFELEKEDALKIREISTRVLQINQDMINNSGSAFDAVFSRLDGVKVESSDFESAWTFSFTKVLDKVLQNVGYRQHPPALLLVLDLLKDVYALDQARQEKEIRIENALATNRMKEIAERRTTTFSLDRTGIENILLAKFKVDGKGLSHERSQPDWTRWKAPCKKRREVSKSRPCFSSLKSLKNLSMALPNPTKTRNL
jgi:hypothetical protein